jgi:hypothetical protein
VLKEGLVQNMKWIPKEIETCLSAKEYVDTAVVPLYSVALGAEMKESAEAAEFITMLTSHLERQFTGRLLLFPPFTYLNSFAEEVRLQHLQAWEKGIIDSEFKHIFYITSDLEWRSHEELLKGTVIWLPSMPFEGMNDSQKMTVIDRQVKQLLTIFTRKWHENS